MTERERMTEALRNITFLSEADIEDTVCALYGNGYRRQSDTAREILLEKKYEVDQNET